MSVRMASVAGQFYEASPAECREHISQILMTMPEVDMDSLPEKIVAGVVPHAGWVFSGELAAMVFATIKKQLSEVDTFVIFGAVHTVRADHGLVYDAGQWGTPLGTVDVDEDLSREILDQAGDLMVANTSGHAREHSIEVQVPFIQHLFPDAKIVPVNVPPIPQADRIGEIVGRVVNEANKSVVCVASTDLSHYGPSYGFTSMGIGPEALKWAKEENDAFFVKLALSMQADKLVDTARMYGSACGAGAVAAVVEAARTMGAARGYLLAHTTSAEVMQGRFGQDSQDSVGYAAIVYG